MIVSIAIGWKNGSGKLYPTTFCREPIVERLSVAMAANCVMGMACRRVLQIGRDLRRHFDNIIDKCV